MCTSGANLKRWNVAGNLLGPKAYSVVDPLMYRSENFWAKQLDNMAPKMPAPPPPPQESRMPDAPVRRRGPRPGGTMLTGGMAGGLLNTGGATLLGG